MEQSFRNASTKTQLAHRSNAPGTNPLPLGAKDTHQLVTLTTSRWVCVVWGCPCHLRTTQAFRLRRGQGADSASMPLRWSRGLTPSLYSAGRFRGGYILYSQRHIIAYGTVGALQSQSCRLSYRADNTIGDILPTRIRSYLYDVLMLLGGRPDWRSTM